MLRNGKKYQHTGKVKQAGIVIILFLFSGFLHAQVEEAPSADTLLHVVDSAAITVEPKTEEGEEYNGDGEEKKQEYFLAKIPGAGPDSLYLRHIADSILAKMKQDEDFWYANTSFKKPQKQASQPAKNTPAGKKNSPTDDSDDESTDSSSGGFFTGFLWLLIIGGFIAFLFIYLSNSNVRVFRKSKTLQADEEDEVRTDDIFAIPYQKEIDKAIAAGNYRLAVRLLFLRLLRRMTEKEIIRYTPDRTNFDYLLQVQQTPWYAPFFRLTRHYEYVWYGLFEIDRGKFDAIKDDFTNLERQLR